MISFTSTSLNQYYWIVGVSFVVCCCYASATLLVEPRNTSALERHRVQLNCSTSDMTTPISWQYVPAAQGDVPSQPKDVFLSGRLVNSYQYRFEMHGNSTAGDYNLVIPSVQLSDTGTYRCRDQDGRGAHVDVNLNITENTDLRIAPAHAEAQVGARVQLICITYYKTEPVNWQHIPIGKSLPVDVYISRKFVNAYTSGYDAYNNNTGANNLMITSAKLGDGGIYRCIEKEGHGQHKDAELTVIDAVKCQMFTNDTCGTSPENVTLECNMTFSGKFAPLIQWVTAKGDVVDQGVATTNYSDRVTSVLVKEVDNPSLPLNYTCRATISRTSCKPKNLAHCQTEAYDSSTHSIDPNIDQSSTENKLNFLWFLLLLIIPIVVVAIVVWQRRRNQENQAQQQRQEGIPLQG